MLVFSTQLCDLYSPLFPLSPSLRFNSPPPPFSCVNKYTRIQCERGRGMGLLGLRQINTCRKVTLQVNIFR
jgi:hypothetical protein